MPIHKRQEGFATLLCELLGLMVMMIVMTAAVPSYITARRLQQQQDAVLTIKRIRNAVQFHSEIYEDGYRSPGALAAARSWPASCEGSGLLGGNDAQSKASGYTYTWTFTGGQVSVAPGCSTSGYQGFILTHKVDV
jgi:Tfp pilus assembly protein PilW